MSVRRSPWPSAGSCDHSCDHSRDQHGESSHSVGVSSKRRLLARPGISDVRDGGLGLLTRSSQSGAWQQHPSMRGAAESTSALAERAAKRFVPLGQHFDSRAFTAGRSSSFGNRVPPTCPSRHWATERRHPHEPVPHQVDPLALAFGVSTLQDRWASTYGPESEHTQVMPLRPARRLAVSSATVLLTDIVGVD